MKILNHTILLLLVFSTVTYAQPPLTDGDFAVGQIAINAPIDAVLPHLGKPMKMDFLADEEVGGFTVYYYDGLIIWAETQKGVISSFDIHRSNFITSRGLRVGDSVTKLEHLYGKKKSDTTLNRLHNNYDTTFKDFTELKIYDYDRSESEVLYAVFYIKGSKVVRIYLYRGLGC